MKSQIARILQNLAFLNLVLATSTASAAAISLIILSLPLRYEPLLIIFLVTFAGYTFNRYTDEEDKISHPKRADYIQAHGKTLFLAAITAYVFALLMAWQANLATFFLTSIPAIAISMYSIKWIPNEISRIVGGSRIKEFYLVKNVFVAFIWSFGVVFLLVSYFKINISSTVLILWLFFFGRFLINTAVFDLKDIEGDRKFNIKSLPVKLGWNKTLHILKIANILFLAIIGIAALGCQSRLLFFVNIFATAYSMGYIYLISGSRSQTHFICDVFVDGEYIVMALFVLCLMFASRSSDYFLLFGCNT